MSGSTQTVWSMVTFSLPQGSSFRVYTADLDQVLSALKLQFIVMLMTHEYIIIIIRRFIKHRSSAEAEGKGAVHVFNVLEAIIRMFKKMCFEPRFKSFQ